MGCSPLVDRRRDPVLVQGRVNRRGRENDPSSLGSLGRKVRQYRIPGRFELLPIRDFAHPEVSLVDILLVEKGVDRAQGGAKQVVAMIVELGFAPDAAVNLADQRGVRDLGSIGHHSVPAEGVEDEPRDRAAERLCAATGYGRIGSVTAGHLVLAAVPWPYQYSITRRGGVRDEPRSLSGTGRGAGLVIVT